MKAARFYDVDLPLRVEDVPIPEPKPGEVLIKVAACGMCHSDISIMKGFFPAARIPLTLGHEASGTIERLGEGVARYQVGDRVVINWLGSPCGDCPSCQGGFDNLCMNVEIVGLDRHGAYAEYITVPLGVVIPLRDRLPLEESSIIADAITTPYHSITSVAQITSNDSVAIIGIGGLGINAVQIAGKLAHQVIAVDMLDWKLESALKLGATDIVNAKTMDTVSRIRELTDGKGVDTVLDFTGASEAISDAFWSIRDGGQIVVTGLSPNSTEIDLISLVRKQVQFKGSYGYHSHEVLEVMKLVQDGSIKLDPIITHRLPLKEINKGFELMRNGETFRTLIIP